MIPILKEMINRAARARNPYTVQGLKACPLCGTLTTSDAPECFVCRWHGEFETDEWIVDVKVRDLVRKCPELSGLLLGTPSWRERLGLRMKKVFSRFGRDFDINA